MKAGEIVDVGTTAELVKRIEGKVWNCISTVSKQLVALRSSASDNRLLRLYQNGSKTPENQGFPGFSYT